LIGISGAKKRGIGKKMKKEEREAGRSGKNMKKEEREEGR
jgi:hypothetical protein